MTSANSSYAATLRLCGKYKNLRNQKDATLYSFPTSKIKYLLRVVEKLTSVLILSFENATKIAQVSQVYKTMLK